MNMPEIECAGCKGSGTQLNGLDCIYCGGAGTRPNPDYEPPDPDGECYRGGEYASALAESQARIQRELK